MEKAINKLKNQKYQWKVQEDYKGAAKKLKQEKLPFALFSRTNQEKLVGGSPFDFQIHPVLILIYGNCKACKRQSISKDNGICSNK